MLAFLIVSNLESSLAHSADFVLHTPIDQEADPNNLAPTVTKHEEEEENNKALPNLVPSINRSNKPSMKNVSSLEDVKNEPQETSTSQSKPSTEVVFRPINAMPQNNTLKNEDNIDKNRQSYIFIDVVLIF